MAREIWVVERKVNDIWMPAGWSIMHSQDAADCWMREAWKEPFFRDNFRVVRYIPAEGHIHEEGK